MLLNQFQVLVGELIGGGPHIELTIVQWLDSDLVLGKDLRDFLNLFHRHVYVVCLLKDELLKFDVGELLVEVLKELDDAFNDLIGQVDQVVSHCLHLVPWVLL